MVDVEVARDCQHPIAGLGESLAPHPFDGGQIETREIVSGGYHLIPTFAAVSRLGVGNVFRKSGITVGFVHESA